IADSIESITGGMSDYVDDLSNGLGVFKPLIVGLKEGIMGGIGIVIPYLIPFLFFIAFLEDSGYIPRMMYLTNGLLRPFGITARSVLGFVLGLGCNVSAIMSLRGLMNNKERILASMVIPFVACSARTVIIMALVVGYLGVFWGLFMYFLSFFVSFLALFLISKLGKFNNPNFVVPVPPYRLPSLKNIFTKIWLRFRAFVYSAWPVLILGTIIVSYLDYFKLDKYINSMFSLLTVNLLNLPLETGIPLIFGVLAKEYALVMLFAALGTENVKEIMTNLQIFTFSVFTLLYTPCLSTISIQIREIGAKYTVYSILLTFSAAIIFSFGLSKLLSAFLR
ncbi:MAG: nucleoside recognition domain-containing protein, partial [bacterium]